MLWDYNTGPVWYTLSTFFLPGPLYDQPHLEALVLHEDPGGKQEIFFTRFVTNVKIFKFYSNTTPTVYCQLFRNMAHKDEWRIYSIVFFKKKTRNQLWATICSLIGKIKHLFYSIWNLIFPSMSRCIPHVP